MVPYGVTKPNVLMWHDYYNIVIKASVMFVPQGQHTGLHPAVQYGTRIQDQ